jgi:hypothetical protein
MAETNVVNINGVDYKEEDLQDNSKYFIAQIKDLQKQKAQSKFKLDQVDAALSVMTNQLIEIQLTLMKAAGMTVIRFVLDLGSLRN